ncbi:MAG: quinate 5-dehydrogenase [Moorella humiferrea]|uniref:quinate 5-dehydrogenase n=1 Tax=Neomoorella humiferrea TaxID=676965 RepID=UPI0019FE2100|nr:quinate 5-dehydrogenase [Moorella humiferrea]
MKLNCGRETILLERRGCNGCIDTAARFLRELDGRVDALGLGGANFFYQLGSRRYPCPEGQYLYRQVKKTPLVDGSGWKQWIEPLAVRLLDFLPFGSTALVVSVLDRYWLAQALQFKGFKVIAGDAAFGLKLPLGFSLSCFRLLGHLTMPLLAHLPLAYLYPHGNGQQKSYLRFNHLFTRAKIIAGDWHFIRHNLPNSLEGKVVVTSGTTPSERQLLRRVGVFSLITTTPIFAGFSPAANAMEAVMTALGSVPEQFAVLAGDFGWLPTLHFLQE